jgi:hypothetical protein
MLVDWLVDGKCWLMMRRRGNRSRNEREKRNEETKDRNKDGNIS